MTDAETPAATIEKPSPFAPFAHADFTIYQVARILLILAGQFVILALQVQVYTLTRSNLHLGLIGLAQFLPNVLLSLPAGHFADHLNRRTIGADDRVAVHADVGRRHGRVTRSFRVRVAVEAGDLARASVELVAERNRLLGRVPDVAERVEERPNAQHEHDNDEEGGNSPLRQDRHWCPLCSPVHE